LRFDIKFACRYADLNSTFPRIQVTKPLPNWHKRSIPFVAFFIAMTSGCGGSGGSQSTAVPTPNPNPNPNQGLVVQAPSLITAAPANYAQDTEDAAVFAQLNAFRASQGLGPVLQSANIDLAAKAHQNYVFIHQSGGDAHNEIPGKTGFTGANSYDRLRAAGYAANGSTEVIAFNTMWPTTDYNAIAVLADSVYHRAGLADQNMTHFGVAPQNDNGPTYIDMGYITPQKNAGNYVGVYPTDGQTGLSLTHYLENPNPFYLEMEMTPDNMCKKTSYPIHLASEASTTLSVTSFTVTENGQTAPLDVRLITKATSPQDTNYLPSNIAFIVGKAPFKAHTKYNVRFVGTATGAATGTANGMAIDKSWSFTTGTDLRGCK
jgi:uncharacterized protein YkwD